MYTYIILAQDSPQVHLPKLATYYHELGNNYYNAQRFKELKNIIYLQSKFIGN